MGDILVSPHFCCQQRPGNGVLVLRAPGPFGCRTDLFDFGVGVALALDDVRQPSSRLGILPVAGRCPSLLSQPGSSVWFRVSVARLCCCGQRMGVLGGGRRRELGGRKIIPVWGAHLCSVCSFATIHQDLPLLEVTSWKCGTGEAPHPGPTDILEAALLEAPHDQTPPLPPPESSPYAQVVDACASSNMSTAGPLAGPVALPPAVPGSGGLPLAWLQEVGYGLCEVSVSWQMPVVLTVLRRISASPSLWSPSRRGHLSTWTDSGSAFGRWSPYEIGFWN